MRPARELCSGSIATFKSAQIGCVGGKTLPVLVLAGVVGVWSEDGIREAAGERRARGLERRSGSERDGSSSGDPTSKAQSVLLQAYPQDLYTHAHVRVPGFSNKRDGALKTRTSYPLMTEHSVRSSNTCTRSICCGLLHLRAFVARLCSIATSLSTALVVRNHVLMLPFRAVKSPGAHLAVKTCIWAYEATCSGGRTSSPSTVHDARVLEEWVEEGAARGVDARTGQKRKYSGKHEEGRYLMHNARSGGGILDADTMDQSLLHPGVSFVNDNALPTDLQSVQVSATNCHPGPGHVRLASLYRLDVVYRKATIAVARKMASGPWIAAEKSASFGSRTRRLQRVWRSLLASAGLATEGHRSIEGTVQPESVLQGRCCKRPTRRTAREARYSGALATNPKSSDHSHRVRV
ncbi:hypothetical protein PENSPDRAFT_710710 [Peniophora sp. CONT]|nr:hypothetical protein PENSPDRAFT_710710 [Peniophora sp. CONT]